MNRALLAGVANARENDRIEFPGEKRRIGRYRHLQWQVEHSGSGHLTVIYDITTQIELEETREEMITMLVHDLRSPLNSVLGGIEAASITLNENGSHDTAIHYLDVASRNGKMLLETSNSLLDITKFEAGQIALEYAPLAVEAMISDVIGVVASAAEQARITIETSIAGDLPTLVVDNGFVRRAVANLLDNAFKFSPDGGQIAVTVEREADDKIRFSVADTGPGVPEEFRRKIFEKYRQIPYQKSRTRRT